MGLLFTVSFSRCQAICFVTLNIFSRKSLKERDEASRKKACPKNEGAFYRFSFRVSSNLFQKNGMFFSPFISGYLSSSRIFKNSPFPPTLPRSRSSEFVYHPDIIH